MKSKKETRGGKREGAKRPTLYNFKTKTISILSLCLPIGLMIKHLIVKYRVQLRRFRADCYDFFCNISERIADDVEQY